MSKKNGWKKGLKPGIISFGIIFALICVIFHPHHFGGFAITTLISGLCGVVIGIMGSGLDTSTHNKMPDSLEKVKEDTGNTETDDILKRGREMIQEIRSENELIPDSALSEKLDQLEKECSEIFSVVYEKPAKAKQIRKFMDYYLPTTLKMVKGYRTLDERGIAGQEAQTAKNRISDVLSVVLTACTKLKRNIYRDDMLDLTTDIDVLEQMLHRDGLTDSDLEKVAQQVQKAAEIDRMAMASARNTAETQPFDTGVKNAIQNARQTADSHVSGVPMMNGGYYTANATAQAADKNNQ